MTVLIAGLVTLLGALAIALIGWWVASRQGLPETADQVLPRIYRVRLKYFVTLSIVLVLALAATLSQLPYPADASSEPSLRVRAEGSMWAWRFEPASDARGIRNDTGRLIVPVGRPVTFDVTATDVNHGIGIYDPWGRLIGQTQVMPGYVNRLTLAFPEPGMYQVLCLEYCGLAHHVMSTWIEATDLPPSQPTPSPEAPTTDSQVPTGSPL